MGIHPSLAQYVCLHMEAFYLERLFLGLLLLGIDCFLLHMKPLEN